jgi:hypothetical protein
MPPVLPIGYTMRFHVIGGIQHFTYRFDRVEQCPAGGDCRLFVSSAGGAHLYTDEYGLVETRTTATTYRFVPPLRLIQWPLTVGDAWSQKTTIAASTGQRGPTAFEGKTIGYDIVDTPAGRFLAFEIRTMLGGKPYKDFWYAPEARTLVRTIEYAGAGITVAAELTEYPKTYDWGIRPLVLGTSVDRGKPTPTRDDCPLGMYHDTARGRCVRIGE